MMLDIGIQNREAEFGRESHERDLRSQQDIMKKNLLASQKDSVKQKILKIEVFSYYCQSGQTYPSKYLCNKVLLDHRHNHLFIYCLWHLLDFTTELSIEVLCCDRDQITHMLICPFSWKSLKTPGVDEECFSFFLNIFDSITSENKFKYFT